MGIGKYEGIMVSQHTRDANQTAKVAKDSEHDV
jgi:hypothetical protein